MTFDRSIVKDQIKKFIAELSQEERAPKTFSRAEVEEAAAAYYAVIGLPKPQFIWVQNPWQLVWAPAVCTNYRRIQIRIDDSQETLVKRLRPKIIEKIGQENFDFLVTSFEQIPLKQLSALSRIVDSEIQLTDRSHRAPPGALSQGLLDTLKFLKLDDGVELRVETDILEKLGTNLGWFSVQQYTREKPPWAHIPSQDDMRSGMMFDEDLVFVTDSLGAGLVEPPPVTPPGMEWSHFLRHDFALATFCQEVGGMDFGPKDTPAVQAISQLTRRMHIIGCFPEVCFLCEPPRHISYDQLNRIHSDEGPAVVYGGNFEVFGWRNTRVNATAVLADANLQTIANSENMEVMRVLLERYGVEEFLKQTGAQHQHEDETGILYKLRDPSSFSTNPRNFVKFVAVKNSTPEVDGTFKTYFLRVPPYVLKAKEGVAWTFGLMADEYNPIVES